MRFTNPKKGLRVLKANLERLAKRKAFKALTSYRDGQVYLPPVRLRFSVLSPDSACTTPPQCLKIPGIGWHRAQRGISPEALVADGGLRRQQILSLTVTNRSPEELYVYVVNLSSNGAIAAVFPYPEDPDDIARLRPARPLDLFEAGYGLLLEDQGLETLKVIATKTPIDIGVLEQDGYRRRDGPSKLNPLEQLLAGTALLTRGEKDPPPMEKESWGVVDVEFGVR